MTKTNWEQLSADNDYPNPQDMLADWYYNKEMTVMDIALKLNLSESTVYAFMDLCGMKRRPRNSKASIAWRRSMGYYVRSDKGRG